MYPRCTVISPPRPNAAAVAVELTCSAATARRFITGFTA